MIPHCEGKGTDPGSYFNAPDLEENTKKCPAYINGKAEKGHLFGNEVVFCNEKVCRYNKEFTTTLSEENMTLCKSKGLLKKTELENPDTNKKSNNPKIYPQSNLIGGNLSKVEYIQFKQLENQPLL